MRAPPLPNTAANTPVRGHQYDTLAPLVLVLLIFTYVHVKWLQEYRFGQSLDIDESGYIAQSMSFARALIGGGVSAWLRAISLPSAHAPLLPVFASLLMYGWGISENVALLSSVIVNILLCVIVFSLASRLSNRKVGLVCAVVVGSIPVLIDFTRTFQFVLAASLFYTVAIYSYFKSRCFTSLVWSVAVGASLALMTLARTMTVAFLPAFAAAFLLHLYLERRLSDRRVIRNIVVAVLAFFVVALTWYLNHYKDVFGYLLSFGYGAHATEYGQDAGFFSLYTLKSRLSALLVAFRPLLFCLIVPLFGLYFVDVGTARVRKSASREDVFGLCVCVLCSLSLLILATSANRGVGFEGPILPAMTVLAVVWIFKRARQWWLLLPLAGAVLSVSAFSFYAKADWNFCESHSAKLELPFFGEVPVAECKGMIQSYLYGHGGLAQRFGGGDVSPSRYREESLVWRDLNAKLAAYVEQRSKSRALITFASRHPLLNVNTLSLEEIETFGTIRPKAQIDPVQLVQSPEGYLDWVRSEQVRSSCFVFLLNRNDGEFEPKADTKRMEDALRADGYIVVESQPTQREGQTMNVWQKDASKCQ